MSFRIKLLSWIVLVNLCITGLLLWSILSNIQNQSEGYKKNTEQIAEQRAEIIKSLVKNILDFKDRISRKKLDDVSAATVIEWDEWSLVKDAIVLLKYTVHNKRIVHFDILLNPLGKANRTFDDSRAMGILETAIEEDEVRFGDDEQGDKEFYIALPIHIRSGLESNGEGSSRVWGGALVQPRFPMLPKFEDRFRWSLFWIAMLGGTFILILVTYLVLSQVVIHPVEQMALAADRVAKGDFSAHCPSTRSLDEIGRLIFSFNYMLDEVRDYHHHLEDRVNEAQAKVKAAEQHLMIAQRLAATGKLAAGIAHEINNPIGGMINAALTLQERQGKQLSEEKIGVYLELITEGLEKIKNIVRKVLIFTPRSLKPTSVILQDLILDTKALIEYRLETEEIECIIDVKPKDLAVFCEPGEMRQVFLNMMINALDAVERASGRIHIRGYAGRDNKSVVIEIIDNGCGMDEKEKSRAFDLFYSTKDTGKGTGLGLSLAHNIVSNHGGSIELVSEKSEGTAIRIFLPSK